MSCSHQDLHDDIGSHHHAVCYHIIYECLSFCVALHTGTYTFLINLLAQNTGRLHQKHDNQDGKHNGI